MEIQLSPAPSTILQLQWGLGGEALGTGADWLQPSSSSCLCRRALLLLRLGLVRTPRSEAHNHIRELHRTASVMTCLPVSAGSLRQTQLSQRTRALSRSHLPVFCSHTLPGTQQGPVIACKAQDSSPSQRHHGPLASP